MKFLSLFALALPLLASNVAGVMSVEPPDVTQALYGRAPIVRGVVRMCDAGPEAVRVQPEQVYIALAPTPMLSTGDSLMILAKSFSRQPVQRILRDLSLVGEGVGVMSGAVPVAGAAISGALLLSSFFTKSVAPTLQASEPTLAGLSTNLLDSGPILMATGDCVTRIAFLPKLKSVRYSAGYKFEIDAAALTNSVVLVPQPTVTLTTK